MDSGEELSAGLGSLQVSEAHDLASRPAPPRPQREEQDQKELNFDVPPFMDAEAADIPKAQKGFLKFICEPLFDALSRDISNEIKEEARREVAAEQA